MRADFFLNIDRFSLSLAAVIGKIGTVLPYVIVRGSNLRRAEGKGRARPTSYTASERRWVR